MDGVTMAGLGLETILAATGAPVRVALRLAGGVEDARQRGALLLATLTRCGDRCSAEDIREVARLARALHAADGPQVARLRDALHGAGSPAALHMLAALAEADGEWAEAAAILERIPDADWGEGRAERLLSCARNLRQAGACDGAWQALRGAAEAAESHHTLAACHRLYRQFKELMPVPCKRRCRLGLVGSATLDLLAPALEVTCFAAGIEVDVFQGAFGQYQQEILAPGSPLKAFAPDVVVLAVDWRSLGLPDESVDPEGAVLEAVASLSGLWRRCREGMGAFVIQHNLQVPLADPYGQLSASLPGGRGRLLRRINLALWEAAQEEAGVAILDVEQAAAALGKGAWEDPALWHVAKQYPAPAALPSLARQQAALLGAALGLSSKCLVLDLDGTLWGGVVGEDGLGGIVLGGGAAGEAYVAFQRYIRSLAQRGVVLAVCSKNNDADARQPFLEHPEMVLSLDDIALFVANWRPKDENLRRIAETLNLGLDSLVFVDDSPTERAWVRARLPEVRVPEMPRDPALYGQTLARGMYFEALSLTADDRQRGEAYRANAQRKSLELASAGLPEFLAQLAMRVELFPFDEANLPRIVQLINKTNQFNLTTRRCSESQVRALMARAGCYTQAMRLYDRFGDNGLTGVLIALPGGDGLHIDTWLLSCRVLGREVERVMLGALIRHAFDAGAGTITAEYIPTAKNAQVRDLYDRLGFVLDGENPDGRRSYHWDPAQGRCEWPSCISVLDRTGAPAVPQAVPRRELLQGE